MEATLAAAMQALLSAAHLAHPTVWAAMSLAMGASRMHVGAHLQQQLCVPRRKDWQPDGFFLKKL